MGLNRPFLVAQRNSRCINYLLRVIWMERCVRSRAAGNRYLPEGKKRKSWPVVPLAVVLFDRLVWGQRHVKRGNWVEAIQNYISGRVINWVGCMRAFPTLLCVCSLCSCVNSVHTPVADWAQGSSSEGLWQDLSLNQTYQPHILRPKWPLKIDCHLASAQASVWVQKVSLGKHQTPELLWFTHTRRLHIYKNGLVTVLFRWSLAFFFFAIVSLTLAVVSPFSAKCLRPCAKLPHLTDFLITFLIFTTPCTKVFNVWPFKGTKQCLSIKAVPCLAFGFLFRPPSGWPRALTCLDLRMSFPRLRCSLPGICFLDKSREYEGWFIALSLTWRSGRRRYRSPCVDVSHGPVFIAWQSRFSDKSSSALWKKAFLFVTLRDHLSKKETAGRLNIQCPHLHCDLGSHEI